MPHVLIVDDHEATRVAMHDVLDLVAEERHYVVTEAPSGQHALDALRAGTDPTVVLFDLRMPGMDGQQFLHQVQADPALASRCVLVCVTASPTELSPEFRTVLEDYDIPLLAKPFDIDDLLAVAAAAADKLPALRTSTRAWGS